MFQCSHSPVKSYCIHWKELNGCDEGVNVIVIMEYSNWELLIQDFQNNKTTNFNYRWSRTTKQINRRRLAWKIDVSS